MPAWCWLTAPVSPSLAWGQCLGMRCCTTAGTLQTNPGLLKDSSLAQSRAGSEQGKKGCSVHPVNFAQCIPLILAVHVHLSLLTCFWMHLHGSWEIEKLQGGLLKTCQHGHIGGLSTKIPMGCADLPGSPWLFQVRLSASWEEG